MRTCFLNTHTIHIQGLLVKSDIYVQSTIKNGHCIDYLLSAQDCKIVGLSKMYLKFNSQSCEKLFYPIASWTWSHLGCKHIYKHVFRSVSYKRCLDSARCEQSLHTILARDHSRIKNVFLGHGTKQSISKAPFWCAHAVFLSAKIVLFGLDLSIKISWVDLLFRSQQWNCL